MGKLEEILIALDGFNKVLIGRKREGGSITPEEFTAMKEMVRNVNAESTHVEIPEIGRLLGLYDLGIGVRYLEPNYERLNAAFSWLEQQEGAEHEDDEDF